MKHFPLSPRGCIFLLAAFCVGGGLSLAQMTFQRIYGETSAGGSSVQQTSDGGYVIAGYTYPFGSGRSDLYLIKTNFAGDTLWTKSVGGPDNLDNGSSVQQTSDGGYVIAGTTGRYDSPYTQVYLIKTNPSGDTLWAKAYGAGEGTSGSAVQQTSDGGYIIAGIHGAGVWSPRDAYLIKTNATGEMLWSRTYGDTIRPGILAWFRAGNSVQQTSDGGYIMAGYTRRGPNGFTEVYVLKTDAFGDILWSTIYRGKYNTGAISIQQTPDKGYIIAGYTNYEYYASKADVYLLRTNPRGDTLWTRTYGGLSHDFGGSVQQTSDGGYIIAGRTESFGAGNGDVYLLKTNSSGDTLWTRTYGGTRDDDGSSVQQTSDGGYVIAGRTRSFSADSAYRVYLIKTDGDGLVMSVQDDHSTVPTEYALLQNYPNPFNPTTVVSYQLPVASEVRLGVYDVLGREISVLVNERKDAGIHEVKFDGSNLSSGMYFYRLQTNDFLQTKRLLLLR